MAGMAEIVLQEGGGLRGGGLSVKGPITIDNAVAVVARGATWFDHDDLIIDLTQVTEVDSSAVSVLLEWQREANRRNCRMSFVNMPPKLQSLVQLYGVSELMRLP